ncbi:unnamed protein product [Orchesella dallaii]|uniref:UBA domain-containing protein n=1 Tax=Orchesella dallaii TaxID=48710 RepID=A0ABP1QSP4_9HEXA
MLVRDPTKRYTIEQVKRHRWMQLDGPPRLLPAPGHPPSANLSHKQYLDPSLIPDVPAEPNEQILRLMASLGIDSSRTRESLRQQSYDHHAAIYYLLLERLRQHRPGGHHRYGGSSSGGPPTRMMSTDSATCRRAPRRPSTIAEHAMRKSVPGSSSGESQPLPQPQQSHAPAPGAAAHPEFWKSSRTSHGAPSQMSSVDEGVADMDSSWDPDPTGSSVSGVGPGSSMSSGIGQSIASSGPRSRADWKWPTRGSTGSSVQISSDLSQASGSPRESVSGSGTTLSSWDSAWEPGGLAASLPSCTAQPGTSGMDERRSSITDSGSPLSPGPCLTSDRLWVPPSQPPGSPTEFRLGRRASDGVVGGRKVVPFNNKLDGARAGGVAALASNNPQQNLDMEGAVGGVMPDDEGCEPPIGEPPLNFPCSPAKRTSLPDSWKMLPETNWSRELGMPLWATGQDQGQGGSGGGGSSSSSGGAGSSGLTSTQLHRQLMALRLQRRAGVVEPPDLQSANVDSANSRKAVLRQQSYKLAQQQPVLPPLPPGQAAQLGLDPSVFRPISEEESRLQAHQEEDEEGDEDDICIDGGGSGCQTARHSPWPQQGEIAWQTLPVTMGECKLTDSNGSLSRLSPLLQMGQYQSLQSTSPVPFRWDPQPSSSLHIPQPSSMLPHQERMDTSGS